MHIMDASSELVLKVLLVGAPKVGKTSLVRRMLDKGFREEYVQTFGFDISVVPFGTYQGRPVKLHLWDVAGSQLRAQPDHHALIGQGADGVMYVIDVTSRESLQAVDDWDQAISKFLPPTACKLLVGHKADLPAYVVNDEALSLYVAGASGFKGWCLTVGSSEYGDYDVAARRGGGGATTADGSGRYKGQSLSGEKQLSVSEAVRTLLGHVFRSGGAGGGTARPAEVLGLGASAGRATPLPSATLDGALEAVGLLGLGIHLADSGRAGENVFAAAAAGEGGELSGEKSGERTRKRFAEGMEALLERGREPDPSWRGGGGEGELKAAAAGGGGGGGDVQGDRVAGVDLGWRYFAGRMGREEAEALLRGRPDGTFLLRRKGPATLVLTYAVLSKRPGGGGSSSLEMSTPGSGGKHRTEWSPSSQLASPPTPRGRDALGSPRGEQQRLGSGGSAARPSADLLADNTTVQHALLVYEGGFYSDEKGRLGKFLTIQELLESKISALARYPLCFRRKRDRYVLIDDAEKTVATGSNDTQPSTKSAPPPLPSNPFTRADGNGSAPGISIRGVTADSLAPSVNGDLFGVGNTRGCGEASEAKTAASQNSSALAPPPPPPPPLRSATTHSLSPPVGFAEGINLFDQALQGRRSSTASTGEGGDSRRSSSDWTDKRADRGSSTRRRTEEPNKRSGAASSATGGGWLEAAAAAEKSGAAVVGGPGVDYALSGGWGSVGGEKSMHGTTAGRRVSTGGGGGGSRRQSLSSTDSSTVSSPSFRANTVDDRGSRAQPRQDRQGGRRSCGRSSGGRATSAMEAAAKEAAAMASAKGHPEARRVEERTLSAQAKTDRAMAALEQRLRPLIVRENSGYHSPSRRCLRHSSASPPPSATDLRRGSGRRISDSSLVSSLSPPPRDSLRSPELSAPQHYSGGERQQQRRRWVAAAPEGTAAASDPLVAAAILLMERAWLRRRDLVGSVDVLRERAVTLAVAETSATSTAAASAEGHPDVASIGGGGGVFNAAPVEAFGALPVAGRSSSRSSSSNNSPWSSPSLSPQPPSSPLRVVGRRHLLSEPAGPATGGAVGGDDGEHRFIWAGQGAQAARMVSPGDNARSSTLRSAARRQEGQVGRDLSATTTAAADISGGISGLSCCLDFDRILGGDEGKALRAPPLHMDEETTPPGYGYGSTAGRSSSVFRGSLASSDREKPLSDSSVVAQLSFSAVDQQSRGSEVMAPAASSAAEASAARHPASADGWRAILRDVASAEKRVGELASVLEAAGGALQELYEDLGLGDTGGRFAENMGLASQ